jgi:hypothetical protein
MTRSAYEISWDLWRNELRAPTPEARRADRPRDPKLMTGYWRIQAARTKPDYPVLIFTEETGKGTGILLDATLFTIGNKVMNTVENAKEWQEFLDGSWLHCVAVEKGVYAAAADPKGPGLWPDKKPARQISAAEKQDVIAAATDSEGRGTNTKDLTAILSDARDAVAEEDPYFLQIKDKLDKAVERGKAIGTIDSMAKAEAAAEVVDAISDVGKLGEARRKSEKAPWDLGAAAVQGKWVPVLGPASTFSAALKDAAIAFKVREEKRLRAEEEARQRAERERLAAAERERLAAEAEARRRELEEAGATSEEVASAVPSSEDIDARAAQVADEQIAETPPVDTSVRVSTKHGRALSKAKRKVGVITDPDKFIAAIKGQADFNEWLQDKANKLARAGTALDGMKIEEE